MKKIITTKSISYWASVAVIGVTLGCLIQFAKAWTEPTATAPGENVGAPINTSDILQNKTGSLGVSGAFLDVLNSLFVHGNVGVGTQTPNPDKGASGNIDVNDVYLRSTGKWLSEMGPSGTNSVVGGPYYTRTASGTGPLYCFGSDLMVGGGCWAQDGCDGDDSSGFGSRPVGDNGWQCMSIACNSNRVYVRCAGSPDYIYNKNHVVSDCTSAGGTTINDGTNIFCKFASSSCPSGWTQYANYSTTTANTCVGQNTSSKCSGATSCTTGSHGFNNTIAETCSYNSTQYSFWTGCGTSALTCKATVAEVGCY